MPPPFDPTAHLALTDLGTRLRDLAGDAAYAAGRDYLHKGLVRDGVLAGAVAGAVVAGSTDYRVTIDFAGALRVGCTCPAHRRNWYCKHVVAVCVALLDRPAQFRVVEPVAAPPPKPATRRARDATPKKPPPELRLEQQAAGLAMVDRLLAELTASGAAGLGREQLALLAGAAETVRALKLRRLGNLLMALQHLAGDGQGGDADPDRFAQLLIDLSLARQMLGAHREGRIALDPALAEDLLGRTWRESELERVAGLELMPLGEDRIDDGEFRIETSYLADLPTGVIYAERQITPVGLRPRPRTPPRLRLLVDEAGLYPGVPPRRLKLIRARRAALTLADVDRLLATAVADVAELRRRLIARFAAPFGPPEIAAAFRPAALLVAGDRVGAVDGTGRFLALEWPAGWTKQLPGLLPEPGRFAVCGLVRLAGSGLAMRCLSVAGALGRGGGPLYPDCS